MKLNPVVHFEMPYEDNDRLSKFYENVFGWKMKKLGEDMGYYVLAGTTETDEKMMVKTPGTINGGFFPKRDDMPSSSELQRGEPNTPSVVIQVEDIKEHMKKVKEAGGEVLGEPMEIPGVGLYVSFRDTEGNRVGMLQPKM